MIMVSQLLLKNMMLASEVYLMENDCKAFKKECFLSLHTCRSLRAKDILRSELWLCIFLLCLGYNVPTGNCPDCFRWVSTQFALPLYSTEQSLDSTRVSAFFSCILLPL